ncbi:hypothetical protein [Acidaminobacter hydrogenoformans]|uniref:Uncharacterized protein n=1 Tax=Acidaminobacter hydrogenoformans DSM 2784 TaxID=1120920 RepID=A0A1G5RY81_9FIRM|nr:hypothetical protein [Acidaminobacter hydrogenoformans]SCZ78710.1 hypothetical protein SAMN03080599_01395 [Acidaminobacter hydrogenoformans DSM 2784]
MLKRFFTGLWTAGLILTVMLSTGCTTLKSTDTVLSDVPAAESILEAAEAEAEAEAEEKVNDPPALDLTENPPGAENGTSEAFDKALGPDTAVASDSGAGLGPTKKSPESTIVVVPQESASLIAKSENEIIGENQEKNELLNELSIQIDDLIALLDGLDTVQESDLELNFIEE